MRFRTVVLGLILSAFVVPEVSAQELVTRALEGLEFREIGPAVMGGRVSSLAVVESNPTIFYAGIATGGVWLTENDGMSWKPLFDDQPCASIGAVAVHAENPDLVWVGTGEPQNRQSSPYGCGVFRSMDGGDTWQNLGLFESRHVGQIKLHPTDPDVAYVAAVGDLFAANDQRGVYRTLDGGTTWQKMLFVDEHTGAIDLAMDPRDPNTLFAAMYQRRRTSFGFSASGGGSGLYRSRDGGVSWAELTEGLPTGEKGRIGIDVYRGDGSILYVTVEAGDDEGGVFRSDDRGDSWSRVSTQNPRPMYFSLIRIDPNDSNHLYLGGTSLSASDDGGESWWDADGDEVIHVDHHALWIDPSNSNHVLVGNDGGVSSTWDGAENWRIHNNFALGQFYEIGVDSSEPYRVCGGLQDNDAWCGPSRSSTNFGLRNRDWVHLLEGDGFHSEFEPGNSDVLYAETQGGNVRRLNLETNEVQFVRPSARPTEDDEDRSYRYGWNSPLVPSEHVAGTVYLGGNHLMRSRDRGATWEEASPDLTRQIDRDTIPVMGQLVDENTLSQHDGVGEYGTITAIEESPVSESLIYVGTDDGNLQVTIDGGATWTNVVGNLEGLPARSYVSRIDASHEVEGRVYASFDGHLDGDYRPFVYVSEDFGASWREITSGLPPWSVNVVREHPSSPDLLFVGNEIGVYVSIDRGGSWHRMSGIPTVPVDDLLIHPRDNDLVVGTHGRSIWILDDVSPLEDMARGGVLERNAYLFGVPTGTQWFLHEDWPFWGDAYEAENPPNGVAVRYWLSEEIDEAPSIRITTATGQTVRELEGSADAGLQSVVWDLRETAPEIEGALEDEDWTPPQGALVMPGIYLAHIDVGNDSFEQDIRVRLDPGVEGDTRNLRARNAAARSVVAVTALGQAAQGSLGRVEEQITAALELLESTDAASELVTEAEAIGERLDSLRSDLGAAVPGRLLGNIESTADAPTADLLWQIDQAWEDLPPLVDELNEIVTVRMPAFNRSLDAAGVRADPGEAVVAPARPPGG
jgi:photosystem II stability/assembly factor-like uncharacterized protein